MSQGFVANTPSVSQMHSLRITEKICPEARQDHLLLDRTNLLKLSTVNLEQQNPSVLLAAIMDYIYVEGTKQNGA